MQVTCMRHGDERFEPVHENFFFVRIPLNAVKIINSPQFTAFTAKSCNKYAVKIIYFHSISPNLLRKFNAKPRPGWDTNWFFFAHRRLSGYNLVGGV